MVATSNEALAEVVRNLKNVQGSWSYQVLNNIDELVNRLRGKVDEGEIRAIEMFLETGVKHPIRRQLGRVATAITAITAIRKIE